MNTATAAETPVLLGVVMPDLPSLGRLVGALAESPVVRTTEFSFAPPVYKGTPEIVAGLANTTAGLAKFELYYQHAVLNGANRQMLAQAFRKAYLQQKPRSEGQDVYLASGDVLGIRLELHTPANCPDPAKAWDACAKFSHDPQVLAAAGQRLPLPPRALQGQLKIFLEDPHNRRRRDIPSVQQLCTRKAITDPVVAELAIVGALPGLFVFAMEPLSRKFGGGMVLLPG